MLSLNRIIAARTLLAATALGAVVTSGCSTGGYYRDDYYDAYGYDDGYYYDRPAYSSRAGYYYHDPYPYHDHYYRDYHRQAKRVRVPREADRVAGGDQGLEFTPDQPGRVYVRDERTGKVIYRGRVQPGDDLKVAADARGRRVSVDGKTVRGDLSAKPRERDVFFLPDRGAASRAERSARQAAARVQAREARAARTEARRESRAAQRGGGGKRSGKKGD